MLSIIILVILTILLDSQLLEETKNRITGAFTIASITKLGACSASLQDNFTVYSFKNYKKETLFYRISLEEVIVGNHVIGIQITIENKMSNEPMVIGNFILLDASKSAKYLLDPITFSSYQVAVEKNYISKKLEGDTFYMIGYLNPFEKKENKISFSKREH